MSEAMVGTCIVGTLLFIFFVPTSWIVYRNLDFRLPLKISFSLTVVPLFIFLMAKNYFFVADHFPKLINLFNTIPESRRSSKGAAILAFFITCPLSFAGCYVWFKVHDIIDKKISEKHAPDSTSTDETTDNNLRFFHLKWMCYFSIVLLVNLMVGFNVLSAMEKKCPHLSPVLQFGIIAFLPLLTIALYIVRRKVFLSKMNTVVQRS